MRQKNSEENNATGRDKAVLLSVVCVCVCVNGGMFLYLDERQHKDRNI